MDVAIGTYKVLFIKAERKLSCPGLSVEKKKYVKTNVRKGFQDCKKIKEHPLKAVTTFIISLL